MIFEQASLSGINGLIFTFVYSYPEDSPFIKDTIRIVENNGGKVYLVQLICRKEELLKRVGEESRKKYKKINTQEKLNTMMEKWNLTTSYPDKKGLMINTTTLSPRQTAEKIIDYYGL